MVITYVLFLFRKQELLVELNKNKIANAINKQENNNNNSNGVNNTDTKNLALSDNLAEKFEEYLDKNQCTQPNVHNPFMNPLPFDNRHRNPACNLLNNPLKQAEVEVAFDTGRYRDVNDIFNKNNAKRQFVTLPNTTYPNNQGGFANWLYKTPPTCKEGNGAQCVANNYDPVNMRMGAGGSAVVT